MRRYSGPFLSVFAFVLLLALASGRRAWAGEAGQTIPTATIGAGPATPAAIPTGLVGGAGETSGAADSSAAFDPWPVGSLALVVAVFLIILAAAIFLRRPRAEKEQPK